MTSLRVVQKRFKSSNLIGMLLLLDDSELMGTVNLYLHPASPFAAEVHIYIKPKYRKKWLHKNFAKEILSNLIILSKKQNIITLYSTATTSISPKLLEFFGFSNYYQNYYLLRC